LWGLNLSKNKVIIGLSIFGALVLILAGTRGFYSWDYFSLWGMQAKTVWATGNFFSSGADTPLHFSYESVLGAIYGYLNFLVAPKFFSDIGLGILTLLSVVLMSAIVLFKLRKQSTHRSLDLLIFIFFLLLISPGTWGQLTFGGYVDLVASLSYGIFIVALLNKKWLMSSLAITATVFLKPILWVWLVIALMAMGLSLFFDTQKDKKQYLVAISLMATLTVLSFALERFLFKGESLPAPSYRIAYDPALWSFKRVVHFIWVVLKSHNLLSAASLGLALYLWKREKFWFIFYLGSVAYLFLIYFVLFAGVNSPEAFPSLNRYIITLLVPFMIRALYLENLKQRLWRHKRFVTVLSLALGTLLIARSAEELLRFKDGADSLARRTQVCQKYPELCHAAQEYRMQFVPGHCKSYILPKTLAGGLEPLVISYLSLPERVFFESSRIPKSLEPACRLR